MLRRTRLKIDVSYIEPVNKVHALVQLVIRRRSLLQLFQLHSEGIIILLDLL
jgi:hypothetical protein